MERIRSIISKPKVRRVSTTNVEENASGDDEEDECWGFKELITGNQPVVDIVAVHGLNGHREKTWRAENGKLWLNDFLPTRIPNARILTYGYDSRTHGNEALSEQTLDGHGLSMLSALSLFRESTKTTQRPIIFLAHSLGGIIVKSALIHALLTSQNHNEKFQAVKVSTYGIMFFGTPHQGSPQASLGMLAARIVAFYKPTNDTILKHLAEHSEWLSNQLESYKAISGDFDTKFCYETYPTQVVGGIPPLVIVPQWSASVPGASDVDLVEIRKNHVTMVKFKKETDNDFITISQHLSIMVDKAPRKIDQNWKAWNERKTGHAKLTRAIQFEEEFSRLLVNPSGFELRLKQLPYRKNDSFIGRHKVLEELHSTFTVSKSKTVAVLHGPPGVGKTQLAIKYCHDQASYFSSTFWVNAATLDTTRRSFLDIAEMIVRHYVQLLDRDPPPYGTVSESLGLKGIIEGGGSIRSDNTALSGVAPEVLKWLSFNGNDRWLLVFDNYDDPKSFCIRDFFPTANCGKILVTTRRRDVGRLGKEYELDVLSEKDAVRLLLQSSQISSGVDQNAEQNPDLLLVVRKLGYLPLAVDQAGAYIFTRRMSCSEYLREYEINARNFLNKNYPPSGITNQHKSVYITFEASIASIEKADPIATQLLHLSSFYSDGNIPKQIFATIVPHAMQGCFDKGTSAIEDHLENLYSFSLVKRAENACIYIHPVVRVCARKRLNADQKRQTARVAFSTILSAVRIENEYDCSSECLDLGRKSMPHLKTSSRWVLDLVSSSVETEMQSLLWKDYALLLQVHGSYQESEIFYHQALRSETSIFGRTSLVSLRTKLGLARLYRMWEKNGQAGDLYDECLRHFRKEIGLKTLETARSLAGLGTVRWKEGKFVEAEALLKQSIPVFKELLGESHPETLATQEALSTTYKQLEQPEKAIKIVEETLALNVEHLGPENPRTLRSMQNLALCMLGLDRFDEAEELQKRVHDIIERQLGPMHPSVLRVLHNLAWIFFKHEKYDVARPYCELAATGREKVLGEDNIDTFISIEVLGAISYKQGLYDDAIGKLERALIAYRSMGSSGALSSFRSLDWLAQIYMSTGNAAQARIHYQESFEGHLGLLGPRHAYTHLVAQRYQKCLIAQNLVEEVEEVERRLKKIAV